MKIIAASLLLFSVMLITFSKSIIALQYELNKKFIAATLCENRNKPMAHCNGHCHLKKTMSSDEQKENAPGNSIKNVLEIQLFSAPADAVFFEENLTKSMGSVYTIAVFVEPCFSVFHPPKTT